MTTVRWNKRHASTGGQNGTLPGPRRYGMLVRCCHKAWGLSIQVPLPLLKTLQVTGHGWLPSCTRISPIRPAGQLGGFRIKHLTFPETALNVSVQQKKTAFRRDEKDTPMSTKNSDAFPGASATDGGMLYKGATFKPIIDKCEGCGRVREFEGAQYCSSYPMPTAKWSMGVCNFSTHTRVAQAAQAKVNPLKASKRAAKGGR